MNILTLVLAHSAVAHALLPVEDEHWIPLHKGAVPIDEDADDLVVVDELDLVGNAEHPVGQWWLDADHLYVRMRVVASPESEILTGALTGSETENGWGVLVDTDGILNDFEYLVAIDERGTQLTVQGDPTGPGWTSPPSSSLDLVTSPLSASMAMTSASGTTLGGSDNSFIDLAIRRDWIELDEADATVRLALVTDLHRITPGFECDLAASDDDPTLEDALSDPVGNDPDDDGLGVAEEHSAGTDPQRPDTDGDGYSDGDEVLLYETDPLDAADPDPSIDYDCDSIPDEIEPETVELDTDPDSDGLSSAEELECGSDPCTTELDVDGDGVPNVDEASCGGDPCVFEDDIDGDGVSSMDEVAAGTDPCAPPPPEDTGSSEDTGASTDTAAPDDTGHPDDTGTSDDGTPPEDEDADCDGILDHEDDAIEFVDDADNDGDFISNALELNACGTDPCSYDIDPDRDGIENERELACGTNPCSPDSDADGVWDNDELNPEDCGPDSDGDGVNDALDPDGPVSEDPVRPEKGAYGYTGGAFTGGGCSHISGAATWPWMVLLLALLGRRQSATLLLVFCILVPGRAQAQSFDANLFAPSAQSKQFVGLEDPIHTDPGFTYGAFLHQAKDPLIYRMDDPSRDNIRVLSNLWSVDLTGGYRFGVWDISLHVPTHPYAAGDGFEKWATLGDIGLRAGFTLLDRHTDKLGLGISGRVNAPTGDAVHWLGADTASGMADVHLSFGQKVVLASHIGAKFTETQSLGTLDTGSQLRWGLGAHLPFNEALSGSLELTGAHHTQSFKTAGAHPIEGMAAGQWAISQQWQLHAGGGTALSRGIGTPAHRIVAGLRYGPPAKTISIDKPAPVAASPSLTISVTNHEDQPMQTRAILVETAVAIDTNAGGNGSIDLPAGVHTLRINQPGYAPIQRVLDIAAGEKMNLAVVISPSRVEVSNNQILIQDRIFFGTGSAEIQAESNSLLDEVAMVLLDDPTLLMVEVQGHTDNTGKEEDNLSLSQARAQAVRQYLIESGVEQTRLQARGLGESVPLSTEDSEEARTRNRRVEFHVVERSNR